MTATHLNSSIQNETMINTSMNQSCYNPGKSTLMIGHGRKVQ